MNYISTVEEATAGKQKNEELKFNKVGEKTTTENEKFYAKLVVKNGVAAYSIKTYNAQLFDPYGMYSTREFGLETKMESVHKDVFDLYMVYLNTRKGIYLTKAQRSFLNP